MARIRATNTKPELLVRRVLHARGFRYRLHDRRLPGRPDIVLPKHGAAILVHGCFWHGHDCPLFRLPDTRREFWKEKIAGNRTRDGDVLDRLDKAGWRVLTVWECATRGPSQIGLDAVADRCESWLCSAARAEQIRGTL